MASTKFGVIYSTGNVHIRRYIHPTFDEELTDAHCGPGEALLIMPKKAYGTSEEWHAAVRAAVEQAAGKPVGDPACCVVDSNNIVVQLIQADADIDKLPGMNLVQAYATIPLGSTYDPATGLFTAPGYTIPAYPGDPYNPDRPPTEEVTVPPTVIPKP